MDLRTILPGPKRLSLLAAWLLFHELLLPVQSVQLMTRGAGTAEALCISISAFENPRHIDGLLENVQHFTEPTTKIGLHLDLAKVYDEKYLAAWNSDRVAVSPKRIVVKRFEGSILWAHMLNAINFEARWPGHCQYFMLQASNQWWVRPGIEAEVSKYGYSLVYRTDNPMQCLSESPIYQEVLLGPNGTGGWALPEGFYLPMHHVMGFVSLVENALYERGQNVTAVQTAPCYFEASWLPTYLWNHAVPPLPDPSLHGPNPVYRNYSNGDDGSLPLEEVRAVMAGDGNWAPFYAVKRVSRNDIDPVKLFIEGLAKPKLLRMLYRVWSAVA